MLGLFLLHKPPGISSAGFLNKLKPLFAKAHRGQSSERLKIGHGGTLDPCAEGLLVVGVGRAYTKKLSDILKETEKEYVATIVLGAKSDTYDREGKIEYRSLNIECKDKKNGVRRVTKKDIEGAIGIIAKRKTQVPPPYSAIKIKGKPAYQRSRAGEHVSLMPRPVKIKEWDIEKMEKRSENIEVQIRLVVSSGFYVRSFAHDLGIVLETGGYLEKLTRTRIGIFKLKEALKIEDLEHEEAELYFQAFGDVQGVGYRYFALKTAQNWALTGFVHNIGDSSVEVVGRAKLTVLSSFLEALKIGPNGAKITSTFDYFRKPQKKYLGFSIKK